MRRALRQYAPALLLGLGMLAVPCVSVAQVLGTVAGTAKDASGGTSLELAYQPYADDILPTGDAVTHLLLADLRGGRFQYLAAAAFGKPAAWRDDWHATNGLPLAVRIQLDPAWRAQVPFPEMVIPLHAGEGFGAQPGGAP